MRESDVVNWLFDEISTFLANSSLVNLTSSEADNHVDEAQTHNGQIYPFVGVRQISTVSETAGIGNDVLIVDSLSYDTNNNLSSITYRRNPTLRVELVPVTDGDPSLRDDLTEDLTDHFALLSRKEDTIDDSTPTDVDGLHVEEATTEGRPDDFVMSDGVPVEIEYDHFLTNDSPTAAKSVNVDVDVGDHDSDITESTDADAFSESF